MITLQDLIDFAKKRKLDPKKCSILLHEVCGNGDIELNYFDKFYEQHKVETLNKDDKWETVETAISLQQLWIPDMFGN
jgi:hypothetical protein